MYLIIKYAAKTIETRCTLSSYSRVVVIVNTLETKICDVSANKTRSTFIKCQILHLKTLKREEERENKKGERTREKRRMRMKENKIVLCFIQPRYNLVATRPLKENEKERQRGRRERKIEGGYKLKARSNDSTI